MLYSLFANITWQIGTLTNSFIAGTFGIFIILSRYPNVSLQCRKILVWAIIACFFCSATQNIIGKISNLLDFFPFIAFLCLRDDEKKALFNGLENILFVIIAVSSFFWGFHLAGIELVPGHYEFFNNYNFLNHYVYVEATHVYTSLPRFQAIFIEPGYTGSLMALLLFIHDYNIKDIKCIVYFIALIMTFSLAGYLLFILGFLWMRLFSRSMNRYLSIVIIVAAAFGLNYVANYNGGDNAVNTIVFSRLESEDGTINQNRTTDEFDKYFDGFITSSTAIFGDQETYNAKYKDSNNVGVKIFIVMNGLVGLFLYIILLFLLLKHFGISMVTLGMFLLFFVFFARGHLFAFSPFFLIVYYSGLSRITSVNYEGAVHCS